MMVKSVFSTTTESSLDRDVLLLCIRLHRLIVLPRGNQSRYDTQPVKLFTSETILCQSKEMV